jgi:excinuclease ABC subunit C
VPLEGEAVTPTESPEERANVVIERLEERIGGANDLALLSDHLSLFRRWYYRPEKQRAGEIFLPNADGVWPVRRILRGAARMVLGEPTPLPEVQREAAKEAKVRILHEGRADVERVVPVVSKRARKPI